MSERERYQRYLASREWAVLKEQVRARSGGICERCKKASYEQTHHLTYARKYQELLGDLQAVCEPCHLFVSGKTDSDPAVPLREFRVRLTSVGHAEADRYRLDLLMAIVKDHPGDHPMRITIQNELEQIVLSAPSVTSDFALLTTLIELAVSKGTQRTPTAHDEVLRVPTFSNLRKDNITGASAEDIARMVGMRRSP